MQLLALLLLTATDLTKDAQSKPLPPAEASKAFTVAAGLTFTQVLAEPDVAQPVFLNFDERGRMWVVEYRQYPQPAGLTMVSHDQFWRAIYDKVPPPPPNHVRGKDRITIHEDTDGDGRFDGHKTFVDGLNITTAVERGRGGVWVLNPPYLLFYPDANDDDVPDGPPVVHLSGFGIEDTHAVVNSLRWGPDGWLYGAQGSTVTSAVIRPGLDSEPVRRSGQLVWRYHPESKRYDIFAEGGGNTFGLELDAKGRIFSGHNGGDTRGFYYVPGGYLRKGFGKHGPLSNPYTFGYLDQMASNRVERFSHNFIIYEADALPAVYRGKLFGVEPLQARVVLSEVRPQGASFETKDLSRPVTSKDAWFRPVDIKLGPDGGIYIADWYDARVDHRRTHQDGTATKDDGRIYKLGVKGGIPPFDLRKRSTGQLVALLRSPNRWFRQTALRLLGDRKDRGAVPALAKMVRGAEGQAALEALWALKVTGALDETVTLRAMGHADPHVRRWALRLTGESSWTPAALARVTAVAGAEKNAEVRLELAALARRMPTKDALSVVARLARAAEDVSDPYQPHMLWWAVEAHASDRKAIDGWLADKALWRTPMLNEGGILGKLMQRYALAGTRDDLLACAALLERSPAPAQTDRLMVGFGNGFKGRPLPPLPDALAAGIKKARGPLALVLRLRGREPEAITEAIASIDGKKLSVDDRSQLVRTLGEVKADALPVLLRVMTEGKEDAMKQAALVALQRYDDPTIAGKVLGVYGSLAPALRKTAQSLLSSRAAWSKQLLAAIADKRVDKAGLDPETLQRLFPRKSADEDKDARARDELVRRLLALLKGPGGDPVKGRAIFQTRAGCGSCHTMFGVGGQIGPDLTQYDRNDTLAVLNAVVAPSLEIREGFENFTVVTKDGRTLTGFKVNEDNQVFILRGMDGQNMVLQLDEIQTRQAEGRSLMPEGLIEALTDAEIRDLFAYLRTTQPV